jgi:tetratricopeptide (TPR) repeat protein
VSGPPAAPRELRVRRRRRELAAALPYVGRVPAAEAAAERAILLAQARGDRLLLASALDYRRNVLVARGDSRAAIEDQRAFEAIGRQLGLGIAEYVAELHLAELYYQVGDVDAAAPSVRRAIDFEEEEPAIAPRPIGSLLAARLMLHRGFLGGARALLERVRLAAGLARASGCCCTWRSTCSTACCSAAERSPARPPAAEPLPKGAACLPRAARIRSRP